MNQHHPILINRIAAQAGCMLCAGCALLLFPTPRSAAADAPPAPAAVMSTHTVEAANAGPALAISLSDAIVTTLERNRGLAVQRFQPQIQKTAEDEQRAAFDPVLNAALGRQKSDQQRQSTTGGGVQDVNTTSTTGSVAVTEYLPTGTQIAVGGNGSKNDSSLQSNTFSSARAGVSVTQSLLQGFGTGANLARVREARLDTQASEYELRGYIEALVAQVESAYWDNILAERQLEIVTDSLRIAEQQLTETEERIRLGNLASVERAAVQAEVASRREELINARSTREKRRLGFLQLLNPDGTNVWARRLTLKDSPTPPALDLKDVVIHVQNAMRMRTDLNQARLAISRGELEVVRTKNGLLPRLDVFLNLGRSGYAAAFGDAAKNVGDGDYTDASVGAQLEYPFINRSERAQHRRARLARDQAVEAVANMEQLAELDVRNGYLEIQRAHEQIDATATTRQFREAAVQAEAEKFRLGKSTTLLLAQADRDLLASRIIEVQSTIQYLKSLIEFYRSEGTLLNRRGIDAPGATPALTDRRRDSAGAR